MQEQHISLCSCHTSTFNRSSIWWRVEIVKRKKIYWWWFFSFFFFFFVSFSFFCILICKSLMYLHKANETNSLHDSWLCHVYLWKKVNVLYLSHWIEVQNNNMKCAIYNLAFSKILRRNMGIEYIDGQDIPRLFFCYTQELFCCYLKSINHCDGEMKMCWNQSREVLLDFHVIGQCPWTFRDA